MTRLALALALHRLVVTLGAPRPAFAAGVLVGFLMAGGLWAWPSARR